MFALRPFLTRYASVFLLFEASTVFLNLRWFLETCGQGDSFLAKLNSYAFSLVFFLARIVYGLLSSVRFAQDVFFTEWHRVPTAIAIYFAVANIVLNGLNLFWFTRIVRFALGVKTPRPPKKAT